MTSLQARLWIIAALSALAVVITAGCLFLWFDSLWLVLVVGLLAGLVTALLLVSLLTRRLQAGLTALDQGLANLMDTDFSVTLAASGVPEIDLLVARYNRLVTSLRVERQTVFQRELLLDTIMENSAMCVLLTDQSGRIIYSNQAAAVLLYAGQAINGLFLTDLLMDAPAMHEAIVREQAGIFPLADDEALYHVSCGRFVLNARQHTLVLLREMTRELSRQEAAAWKKVIRVISHELNNSLAPISSLAHSGQLLLDKGQYQALPDVFATLFERATHLKDFVGRYAAIAKLPTPLKTPVDWQAFYQGLKGGYPSRLTGELPATPGYFDAGQLHQAVQNLLKNAAESGSLAEDITLSIRQTAQDIWIEVADRGSGLPPHALQQALLPFYSTKPAGSGVGLPLCREVVEAHGGRIAIRNRRSGGVRVSLVLPLV